MQPERLDQHRLSITIIIIISFDNLQAWLVQCALKPNRIRSLQAVLKHVLTCTA